MKVLLVFTLLVLDVVAVPVIEVEVEEFETTEIDYELPGNSLEQIGESSRKINFNENFETVPSEDKRNALNIHTFTGGLWTNGIVPYVIHSSYPTSVRNTFIEAMNEITEDTKVHGQTCVQFVPRTSSHNDYIEIVPTTGCHASVGHHPGHGLVSLGHGCERKGTAMHEFLHVLGFYHEHERYDRDNYITVHLDNVATERQKDFQKSNTHLMNTLGVSYDYSSIMHYGAYSFAKDKSKPVLTPKHHSSAVIGQRVGLSRKDVQKIQLLYGCGSDLSHIATPSAPRKYLLAEARNHHNTVARVYTDSISAGDTCVTFSYFIYGTGVNSLSLKAEGTTINHTFKTFSGSQQNQWVNMNYNLKIPLTWKLVFEASIGSSDQGDIAIDDLSIYPGRCVSI